MGWSKIMQNCGSLGLNCPTPDLKSSTYSLNAVDAADAHMAKHPQLYTFYTLPLAAWYNTMNF